MPPGWQGNDVSQCLDCERPDPLKSEKREALLQGSYTAE